jgi:raffinose/stachyose/melibiose transport system substrate-binding protein
MAQSSAAEVNAIVDGKKGVSLTTPQVLQAADTIKSWAARNYRTPGWAAYSNSDVFTKFAGGQGLFALNGSWNVPLPASAKAAHFTMVPFPTAAGAGTPGGVATGDLAWTIPASSRHQALAAEYLNFITSPQAARIWISTGSVPATMPASLGASITSAHLAGVTRDALTDWADILGQGNPVPYLDWATPTFYTTIQAALPELAADKISPAQFARKLQADYGTFAKSR